MKIYGHFIGGASVEPLKGRRIDSFNPYSGEIGRVSLKVAWLTSIVRSLRRRVLCVKVRGPR